MRALNRAWAETPPPHVMLALIGRALGLRAPDEIGEAERWRNLRALGDDPDSGIALSGILSKVRHG